MYRVRYDQNLRRRSSESDSSVERIYLPRLNTPSIDLVEEIKGKLINFGVELERLGVNFNNLCIFLRFSSKFFFYSKDSSSMKLF